jgi:hypothetical protein
MCKSISGHLFNPLKPRIIKIIPEFKDSASTAKKTPHFSITKINWLELFREIIAVYSGNHTKLTNTEDHNAELLIVKESGTYSYHWALKG